MHRHGKTTTGKERYKCPSCGKTSIIHRPDTRSQHVEHRLVSWLTGKKTKTEIAKQLGITRRALTKQFHEFFLSAPEGAVSPDDHPRILAVDGVYLHGIDICVLIALDEKDHIFWMFSKRESHLSWAAFLERFPRPDVIVADGQKGLKSAIHALWGKDMPFQRCQFHVIKLIHEHITREPKEAAGKKLLALLYELKTSKTKEAARDWGYRYACWEGIYEKVLLEKTEKGSWKHRRLRKARGAMRKALPHLFVFLDHEGCPNTTNDVEGWINRALKERAGEHRGLHLEQQKTLVSILLSHLSRKKKSKENPTRKFP